MRKKISMVLVGTILAGLLAACGSGATKPDANSDNTTASGGYEYPAINLSLSTPSAENTGKSYDCRLFIDKVTKASGGKITFTEYFNAALSKSTQNLDAISSGIADCGTVVNLYTPSQLPLSQVSYPQPFGPTDGKMVSDIMTKLSELHPEFYEEYEKNNVHVLAYKGNENYKVYSDLPLESLADLKGKKIGMGGASYFPWFEAVGAVPVSTAGPDTYQNVKTGVIDGMFCYDSFAYEYKWYEVMKYTYNVEMGTRNNDVLCINLDTWNSLDAKTQELLTTCAREAYDEFHAWEADQVVEWDTILCDQNGMKQVLITDEEKTTWAEKALAETDAIQKWIDEVTALGYDGRTFMQDYFRIAEELGWEWAFDTSKY